MRATGAGKSRTVRGLLEAVTGAGIPWLVVEPAKAEYKLMAARLPGTQVSTAALGHTIHTWVVDASEPAARR